jgi:type IV pilus assembly protein PilC
MPVFRWQGVGPRGETLRGEMDAPSREAVIVRLRSQRILPAPAKIRERGKGLDRNISLPSLGAPVKARDVVVFTRQLATMIDAGLPIVQCLHILSAQSDNKVFAKTVGQVKDDLESGSTFADALCKHPRIFDDLYTNMVAAGEVAGILDTILARLSAYMEKAIKLKSKIKGALIYPCIIVLVAFLVTAVLLIWVIPVFAELFRGVGQELPLPTRITMAMSDFARAYALQMLGVAIALAVGIRSAYRTERGRVAIDRLLLRAPVFGNLIRKASIARVTRTLGTLVSAGVPILDALAITARTAGNKIVEQALFTARSSIRNGNTIAEPLAESKVFPPMVCQMIAVGETTGTLDSMLQKIAEFYEDEVDNAVANLMSLMEPLVILYIGVVIGGLVIAMYLPIFKLGSVFM